MAVSLAISTQQTDRHRAARRHRPHLRTALCGKKWNYKISYQKMLH